ncbi:3'(2'),5'-bisphosphate nucleotidase CysQ [Pararhodospirillum oryzae]|uniref:3'(2'),5'-bisphosphate nucleotidase CysQ n=1 Tax=Pararhodospirillum oryzae TaxID=478448 RepID=A0A512HAM6_9PROT|nr:3'(2'),5'-bisphosphate nucleotidase CysQ [Pararhodospirillum oryzae]GEO82507.1 3'(2'),5'-bisphosphate nucleotidase CysQ [Pararhodospirillum oryzae]
MTQHLIALSATAGEAILAIYTTAFEVSTKADNSPVTQADTRAEAILLEGLARYCPDIPVVAEESVAAGHCPTVGDGPFWLVDPLDGTREFIKRNGEFTVNLGLVVEGRPVFGIVHCPALAVTYWGAAGTGAFMRGRHTTRSLHCRPTPGDGATVIASRSHGDDAEMEEFLHGTRVARRLLAGSSLKFCRIAEGVADLYPRLGPTCEWDTCAAHAVLAAAGGSVRTLEGEPLTYGKRADFLNPPFVARGLAA